MLLYMFFVIARCDRETRFCAVALLAVASALRFHGKMMTDYS